VKTLISVGIPLALLILAALSIWFVETRLIALFGIKRTFLWRIFFAGLYILALIGLIIGDKSANPVLGGLYVVGGVLWIFLLYMVLAFMLSFLVESIFKIPPAWGSGLALGTAIIATAWGIVAARGFVVSETSIALSGLPAPFTIMHISDVHLGHHRRVDYLHKIVNATNARHPDLVIINGDLIDAAIALDEKVLAPLREFDAPVYFTGGNHEKYVNQARAEALVEKMGARVLRNENVITHGIQLVGLRYMNADENTLDLHPSDERETIKSALQTLKLDAGIPSVFVHHSPVGVEYMAEKGARLVLSGHTHGGQVFPGTLFARLLFTFSRGLASWGETQVLVSQGAGTFLVPVRSASRNEINLIHLVPR